MPSDLTLKSSRYALSTEPWRQDPQVWLSTISSSRASISLYLALGLQEHHWATSESHSIQKGEFGCKVECMPHIDIQAERISRVSAGGQLLRIPVAPYWPLSLYAGTQVQQLASCRADWLSVKDRPSTYAYLPDRAEDIIMTRFYEQPTGDTNASQIPIDVCCPLPSKQDTLTLVMSQPIW